MDLLDIKNQWKKSNIFGTLEYRYTPNLHYDFAGQTTTTLAM